MKFTNQHQPGQISRIIFRLSSDSRPVVKSSYINFCYLYLKTDSEFMIEYKIRKQIYSQHHTYSQCKSLNEILNDTAVTR